MSHTVLMNRPQSRGHKKILSALAGLSLGLTGLVAGLNLDSPVQAAWNASTGKGLEITGVNPSGKLRLGPHYNQTPTIDGTVVEDVVQWCMNAKYADPGPNELTSIATLTESLKWGPDELDLETPQLAWLLNKYQANKDNTNLAALGYLVHVNFEQDYKNNTDPQAVVNEIITATRSQLPQVDALARQYVAEARNSAAIGYESGAVQGDGQRHGVVNEVGVKNGNGSWVAGIPMTVTLNGPAVWEDNGQSIWSGLSQDSPISLNWRSTGNGEVTYKFTAKQPVRRTLTKFGTDGSVQDMLSYGNRNLRSDPEETTVPGPSWRVIFDFQPVGSSNVVKTTDDGSFTDTFNARAKADYGDGKWLEVDGKPVPVTYDVRAYWVGDERPAQQADTVPAGAELVGSTQVTANGPGQINASFTGVKPGFITVVWSVSKAAQGENSKYIHADWADGYGLPNETISHRRKVEIDSTLSVRETKSGTYLVDDLFVSGFQDDHPDYEGDARFQADVKTLSQRLLFFPKDLEVSDANASQAEVIGVVTVPAKNGFYPSMGSTKFKMKYNPDGSPVQGTYVFVTSFAGDDRVQPFTSSVTDTKEQYVVISNPEPKLATTATDGKDRDKELSNTGTVKLVDKVCYENLTPGKEYTLTGTLMDKATNEPVKASDGKPVTATVTHTPSQAKDCTEVIFEFDSSLVAGRTTVVFERLFQDGKLVAVHTDINDEGQTVSTPGAPQLGTTATDAKDGDKTITADGAAKITDKVCYHNLTPGSEYTLTGTLMDRSTNAPVKNNDGTPVTVSVKHTPTKASDCTNVVFEFDASRLGGHQVTVFEKLHDTQGTLIASHEDINDDGQTVSVEGSDKSAGSAGRGLAFTGAASVFVFVLAFMLIVSGVIFVAVKRHRS